VLGCRRDPRSDRELANYSTAPPPVTPPPVTPPPPDLPVGVFVSGEEIVK